jgi:hypothetical protein
VRRHQFMQIEPLDWHRSAIEWHDVRSWLQTSKEGPAGGAPDPGPART